MFLCYNVQFFLNRVQRRAEREAERQQQQLEGQPQPRTKPKPKKKKVSPEMEDRQKRAAARMLELGVRPLQVRIPWCYVHNT